MNREPIALSMSEESQVGEARRLAANLSVVLGFDQTEQGKVAIVVTEATKNLVKHAQNGELLLQPLYTPEGVGIEIMALDSAPGIQNVIQSLQDGFSTAGTPGTGLGAIQRLSAEFDIYSLPQVGTALIARLWAREVRQPLLEIGTVNLPKRRGEISGDAWAVVQQPDRALILVADGLGSGALAAEASRTAVNIFQENTELHPQAILEKIHAALRRTRGAVAGIAEILPHEVRYAGIGNISAVILTGSKRQSLVSYNGTLGLMVRKIVEFSYPRTERSILVMHSDGLGSQWTLDRYPGLSARHAALIAGILYRDYQRSVLGSSSGVSDDVVVLIAKTRSEL
jgi:anti-sigma regulatory factor (Ser/Thr protein kinase)